MSKIRENYVGAMDIGSSKCCVLIGISRSNDELEIIGFGESSSEEAVLKGDIIDMEQLREQFSIAMNDAEKMANISFADTYSIAVNVSGSTMSFIPSVGSVTIKNADQRITENDYEEACENAARFNLQDNKAYLGMCESHAVINTNKPTTSPIGQSANKLDVHVLLQCIGLDELKNINNLIADLGIDEARMDTIFSGIAGAYGVLSDSEKKNGTLLVDLGAGTTEYVVMNNYGFKAAGVLPVGMDHVINDLSLGLKLQLPLCRQLLESGKLEQILNNNEHFWEYELNRTTYKIPTSSIEAIVNSRLQEIFDIIKIEIMKKNCHLDFNMGGVLIGGGALLSRSHEIFGNTFNFNSRTGIAIGMTGNIGNLSTPRYVTTYGLLKFAHTCCVQNELPDKNNSPVNIVVDKIINTIKKVKDSINI